MDMPFSELLDRYSILLIKRKHAPEHPGIEQECARFEHEIATHPDKAYLRRQLDALLEVNGRIWNLEEIVGEGKRGVRSLAEVGQAALDIRAVNAERIRIKKEIAAHAGEFEESKIAHGSA